MHVPVCLHVCGCACMCVCLHLCVCVCVCVSSTGAGQLVLKPKSTNEVSEILKYCNKEKLAVVPQGGNTGLVGGSVPVFDEIVLSLQLMDRIISIDQTAGEIECGFMIRLVSLYSIIWIIFDLLQIA